MAKEPRSVVIGTAGHIDHGKTALVHALTGVDTDRLPEEKRRGITIELGFAAWELGGGLHASVVDVPGHEALVRTMVAGAGGFDLFLLVVSAEDGVMPQTREHLHVLELLGVHAGVVALTKIDRLGGDPEALGLARDDVRAALAGTPLAEAPILPCSARSGEGLDDLRAALRRLAARLPPRPLRDRPILAVDRAFVIKGHGAVVTGALLSGAVRPGREASLLWTPVDPHRAPRELRVRGLQVRGRAADEALAGARVALNLAGVDIDELSRGDVISRGARVSRAAVAHLLLDHLPHDAATWASGAAVQLCAGAASSAARLDPLGPLVPAEPPGHVSFNMPLRPDQAHGSPPPPFQIPPGGRGLVRARLDPPLPLWHGQRVILRRLHSTGDPAGDTIGGGVVLDPAPTLGRGQRARWIAVARALASQAPADRLSALLTDAGARGLGAAELERRAGVVEPQPHVQLLIDAGRLRPLSTDHWVDAATLDQLAERAIAHVERFHRDNPLQLGLGRATVEASLPGHPSAEVAAAAVERAIARAELVRVSDSSAELARPAHLRATGAYPPELALILAHYRRAGAAPPTLKELEEGSPTGQSAREILSAVTLLQRAGALVRISPDISLAAEAYEALLEQISAHLARRGEIDVQALKAASGLSRKYVVPLLEHLDRIQLTRRVGERRVPGPALKNKKVQ
ncbi:MAG: selenocysteine-specific translation elongation factor [Nannocystis sp.]|nr:selenocysteine-specific translation elongation factor [Nannocystis sp.]